ncbi:orotate phosphoribosyltransferase [Kwoniella europaea PYCC6329]|uniref:orotate phosphoribosyltransferase n=1 Tax=Kwoniella europaea PYCC6329 TaxID=1423913 RepID=A0AAX4KC23_9TREE
MSAARELNQEKIAFIEAAIEHGVLLFGEFTLKSGRKSPYFFNAGLLYTGSLLSSTSKAYAKILTSSRIPEFDVLFGPAYKGIALAAITAVDLSRAGREVGFAYNRKEKKDHGEGGVLVGSPLRGRIVIIDDVLTRGTAIREAIEIIKSQPEATLVGVVQLVDRQERGTGEKSTVQEVEEEFGVPIEPILNLQDIIAYLEKKGGYTKELEDIKEYRKNYGIEL